MGGGGGWQRRLEEVVMLQNYHMTTCCSEIILSKECSCLVDQLQNLWTVTSLVQFTESISCIPEEWHSVHCGVGGAGTHG